MRNSPIKLLTISLIFAGILGCSDKASDNISVDTSTTREVVDFMGRTVRLQQPAQRVVALAPHIVENIFSAGAGEQLVGVVEWSNYPEQAKSIGIVGGYEKINHEKILELNPDLIIAWESGNSRSSVDRLAELGFNIYIDQPDSLKDVARSIKDIGLLTGNEATAELAAASYLSSLDIFEKKYASAEKVSTFYQVWNSPLQSINGKHIISDAIEICGGVNIYANEFAVAPVINIESVLERNPDAIIASGMSDARPEWLNDWTQWSSLTAVKNGNLFFVNPDHLQRHTVRLLLGLQETCRQLDLARARK